MSHTQWFSGRLLPVTQAECEDQSDPPSAARFDTPDDRHRQQENNEINGNTGGRTSNPKGARRSTLPREARIPVLGDGVAHDRGTHDDADKPADVQHMRHEQDVSEPGRSSVLGENAAEEQQRRHLGEEDGDVVYVVDGEEKLEHLVQSLGRQCGHVMSPS